ncbi:PQQ-binding-like beta-propeller repeat protein [Actinotalea ferrariae]|nr:PQQ-binding-like beta-propeller repeat protein [Actinotalea ferrariae]
MRRRTDGVTPGRPVGSAPQHGPAGVVTVHEVDVELVEDAEPRSARVRSRDPDRRRSRPATARGAEPAARRHLGGLATGAALALVGVLVLGLNVATEARSTAAAARVAAAPGVLDAVTGFGVSWTRTDVQLLGVVEDVVLVSSAGRMAEALDARTGAVLWTVGEPGGSGWCTLLSSDQPGIQFERTTPWTPAGEDLACHRSGWWSDGPTDPLRRRTLVEVVDTATGRTTGRLEEDGRLVTSMLVAGDLVPVVARDDGSVVVSRWEPGAARTRWRTVSGPGLATPDAVGTAVLQDGRTLTVRGHTRLTVALADGSPLASHVPALARRRTAGTPPTPPVTDVPDPVALVAGPEGTRVVEPGQGRAVRELWRLPRGTTPVPVADVAGVLVLAGTAQVAAHERRTGRVLWRTETAAAVDPVALTDGVVVLLPVPGDGTTDLAAVRLADGLELWREPLPPGTRLLVPAGAAVVVQARDGVVGVPVSP